MTPRRSPSPVRALLPVAVALLVVTAGCATVLPTGESGDGDDALAATEVVPGGADLVVHAQVAGSGDDPAIRELRELNLSDASGNVTDAPGNVTPPENVTPSGGVEPPDETDPSLDNPGTVAALANASEIDPDAISAVTVFARYPAPGVFDDGTTLAAGGGAVPAAGVASVASVADEGPSRDEGYAAAVVAADWEATELVATLENLSRVDTANETGSVDPGDETEIEPPEEPLDLERTTDGGHNLYVPANDSREGAVGVLDDGVFALGSERAVRDAVDVRTGDREAMNGTLRAAYDTTRADSYARFAAVVPRDRVPDRGIGTGSGFDTTAFANLTAVSGASYTAETDVGFQANLRFADADVAGTAEAVIDGIRLTYRGLVENETAEELLSDEGLSIQQDGPTVSVTSQHSASFWKSAVRALASYDPYGEPAPAPTV